jgi:hypothetical protein
MPRSEIPTRSRCGREPLELCLNARRELDGVGHEHGGREFVVLGLADEVGRHEEWVGRVIRDHQDLGWPRLGIDADLPAHDALCCGDIDVARAGDHLHGVESQPGNPPSEGADRAGSAHGVDLVDAKQAGRPEDRGVDAAAEILLRR